MTGLGLGPGSGLGLVEGRRSSSRNALSANVLFVESPRVRVLFLELPRVHVLFMESPRVKFHFVEWPRVRGIGVGCGCRVDGVWDTWCVSLV